MIGTFFAIGFIIYAILVGQEGRRGTIQPHRNGPQIAQGQFHVSLVIGLNQPPGLDRGEGSSRIRGLASILPPRVGIIGPIHESVTVHKMKGQERISSRTSLVHGGITINQFLNREIQRPYGALLHFLRNRNGLVTDTLLAASMFDFQKGWVVLGQVGFVRRVGRSSRGAGFQTARGRQGPTRTAGALIHGVVNNGHPIRIFLRGPIEESIVISQHLRDGIDRGRRNDIVVVIPNAKRRRSDLGLFILFERYDKSIQFPTNVGSRTKGFGVGGGNSNRP
mmetsp:Transcript_10229/g.28180  ORF Transcript_10229/g.28180 Transcript_10229/m.28180 type:complete len:279 (-) Transcript_10229:805-1641(-)